MKNPFFKAHNMCHTLPVSSTIHTALGELVEAGLIDKTAAGYRLQDPFFVRHIRQSPARIWRVS